MIHRVLGVMVAAAVLAACGTSTRYTHEYIDPGYTGGPIDHILVVAVVGGVTDARTVETGFVNALEQRGVHATAGYTVLPQRTSAPREHLKRAITEAGHAGVILVKLVGVDRRTRYTPGYVMPAYGFGYRGFYGAYYGGWGLVHSPGYYSKFDYVIMETSFYRTGDYELLWGATSESFAPSSVDELIRSVSSKVTRSLHSNGLI